jgi:hypothetical protein
MKTPASVSTSVLLTAAFLGLAAVSLSSCGSAGRDADSTSSRPPTQRTGSGEEPPVSVERVRGAVVRGAVRDFGQGTGIGGAEFESCVIGFLDEALDRPTIERLTQIYKRRDGQALAAQALNEIASPLGAMCGHRSYVPELVEASRGLGRG